MVNYRLYFMSRSGKHIDRFEPIEANNDGEAIEVAKLYRGVWPLELWWRGRRIEAFTACAA